MWIIVRSVTGNRWNQADTPTLKGAEAAEGTFTILWKMDMISPGSKMAPIAHAIIQYVERGKPYALLCWITEVSTPQGKEMAQRKEKRDKKRMSALRPSPRMLSIFWSQYRPAPYFPTVNLSWYSTRCPRTGRSWEQRAISCWNWIWNWIWSSALAL